jgi:PD-(D/E)XK endonuclease
MADNSFSNRSWTDSQLAAAVIASRSWRGVMRELGLCATSAGAIRVVKRHVARLGLDTSHFTGQRRWSDAQLRRAVATAFSWPELMLDLGLAPGSTGGRIRVKAHAIRLGLDLSRLDAPRTDLAVGPEFKPDINHLRDAGTAIAAMWFLLCGYNASIPMEPTIYDLLVSMPDGVKRVQVKTTTYYKDGWEVQVGRRPNSVGNRGRLVPYDPDLVDFFFISDGDLTMYVIPSRVIAGRVHILASNYSEFVVGSAAFLMGRSAPAA